MAVIDAEEFEMMSSMTTQVRVDGDAVKLLLEELLLKGAITQEEKEACFKEIKFVTIKTSRKDSSKKEKFQAPSLANATPEGVVDMLGVAREKEAVYKKEGEYLKDWLQNKVIKPEDKEAEKVQPVLGDDDKPSWAL